MTEVAFPEIKEGLVIRPGDTAVFTVHDSGSVDTREKAEELIRRIEEVLPEGVKVRLIDGMTLTVIRKEEA